MKARLVRAWRCGDCGDLYPVRENGRERAVECCDYKLEERRDAEREKRVKAALRDPRRVRVRIERRIRRRFYGIEEKRATLLYAVARFNTRHGPRERRVRVSENTEAGRNRAKGLARAQAARALRSRAWA